MMMEPSVQKKILAALLIFLAGAVVYRVFHPFEQKQVDHLTHTGKRAAPGPDKSPGVPEDKTDETGFTVMLSVLTFPAKTSGSVTNPHFFYKQPVASPPIEETPALQPPEPPAEGGPKPPEKKEENPYDVVNQELSKMTVLGIYTSGGDRAVFFQRQKQTILLRKGDLLDGKYRVSDITLDEITLKAEHLKETVHIDLKPFLKPHEREMLKTP